MSSSEAPFFCKSIVDDTIRLNKLRFPRKFVRKHGSELTSPVQLTVPDGVTFLVEVTKSDDGEVWLENGWQQFSEHYSLKNGYFLVFEYEGNCSFQVLIFDLSAADVDSPYISDSDDGGDEECQPPKKEKEEAKDNNAAEALNQTPPESKTAEKHRAHKKRRNPTSEYISDSDSNDKGVEECQQPKKEEGEAKDNTFTEVLNQTPPESKTGDKDRPRKKRRKTTSGKNKNHVEYVSSSEGSLLSKVVRGRLVFGAKEGSTPLQRAAAFKSDNPFFVVEIQPSYVNPGRKMVIPSIFTEKYLLEKEGGVTLCTWDGKTWSARYLRYVAHNKYTKAVLCDGWRPFRRDNKLKVGDVCIFELTKQTEILFKVIIYRVREDSNCGSSSGGINSSANCGSGGLSIKRSTKSKKHCVVRPLTSHEKERALQKANHFKSENPYFKVVMQPAYVDIHRCNVNIPYKFAKKYLDEKVNEVVLQVSDGRSWVVKLSVNMVGSGQKKARFCETWKNFVKDNNLKVGDVCVFELIDHDEASFKISIY